MTKTLMQSDLAQFTGTEQIWRHSLIPHIRYTDGARYVAQAGGAYWLIDKIACAQLEPKYAQHEFQLWQLTVNNDLSADLVCTDGNGDLIASEHIDYTDFPIPQVKLYMTNSTILLPSEY